MIKWNFSYLETVQLELQRESLGMDESYFILYLFCFVGAAIIGIACFLAGLHWNEKLVNSLRENLPDIKKFLALSDNGKCLIRADIDARIALEENEPWRKHNHGSKKSSEEWQKRHGAHIEAINRRREQK